MTSLTKRSNEASPLQVEWLMISLRSAHMMPTLLATKSPLCATPTVKWAQAGDNVEVRATLSLSRPLLDRVTSSSSPKRLSTDTRFSPRAHNS
jgi:hypothetical protein